MITAAISSLRPHGITSVYDENHRRASESWNKHFNRVVIVEGDSFPSISRIAARAGEEHDADLVTVLNGDIVLGERFAQVQLDMLNNGISAATSRRQTFEASDTASAKLIREDRGLDIWVADPDIWSLVANRAPRDLLFGHCLWDTWMLGFLKANLGLGFRDFTNYACVLHPRHEDRRMPHNAQIEAVMKNNEYVKAARPPSYTVLGDPADWAV